ncbi:hypothetical protein OH77DRAFT_1423954 [Trametes cingulata]|nr:hypothetical protein OH77DRAFT_1423954 [Trametes cingulata]
MGSTRGYETHTPTRPDAGPPSSSSWTIHLISFSPARPQPMRSGRSYRSPVIVADSPPLPRRT